MTIADRTWDRLPPEIHSRIIAATAHADVRQIHEWAPAPAEAPGGRWDVDAITGDRFVHMTLGLRTDHSVSEETRSFLLEDVVDVSVDPDGSTLVYDGPSGPESLPIAEPIARALSRQREGAFEGAVKGIGQGLAGRLKQAAGEILDLPALEQEGIEQQVEAETRRARANAEEQ